MTVRASTVLTPEMLHVYRRQRRRASEVLWRAIRKGKIPRLSRTVGIMCVDCGAVATCYDHRDYSKPLEVEPVCQSCNAIRGAASF